MRERPRVLAIQHSIFSVQHSTFAFWVGGAARGRKHASVSIREDETVEVTSPLRRTSRVLARLLTALVVVLIVAAAGAALSPSLRQRFFGVGGRPVKVAITSTPTGADVFIDEGRVGLRVFPIQGPVQPYIGFGVSVGLYAETISDIETEMDFAIGGVGSVGVEIGEPDKFMIAVEASYLANSVTDYGGSQMTISLVFKH